MCFCSVVFPSICFLHKYIYENEESLVPFCKNSSYDFLFWLGEMGLCLVLVIMHTVLSSKSEFLRIGLLLRFWLSSQALFFRGVVNKGYVCSKWDDNSKRQRPSRAKLVLLIQNSKSILLRFKSTTNQDSWCCYLCCCVRSSLLSR